MRLLELVPGTGSFLCGSCLRDTTLARALRAEGHEVDLSPLYLPFHLEQPGEPQAPVQLGGINVYLQHKGGLGRALPDSVARMLDAPGLLKWASKRMGMTSAEELGETTVALLRGETGPVAREIGRLAAWARARPAPDVVLLSNAMLASLAKPLSEATGAPVVVTLQGEAPFLDSLPEPHRSRAWEELRARCADVAAFVPVSRAYGAAMAARLGLDDDDVHPVWNGIELGDFGAELHAPGTPTVLYLARLCEDKGLPTAVSAYLELRERVPGARLVLAGVSLPEDEPLVQAQRARLRAAGALSDAEIRPNVSREEKLALLRQASVLTVPATYGESFGLYLLEAWAAGVPVVQPACDAFPELLERTGGGVLVRPGSPTALAEGLAELLQDEDRRRALGDAGRAAVLDHFTATRMAREVADVCAAVRA